MNSSGRVSLARVPAEAWGRVARGLHWSMAVLLLFQVGLGRYAHELALSPEKVSALMWHKSLGIVLLCLAVTRLAWRIGHASPPRVAGTPVWQHRLAFASHGLLYASMIAIPLSGWLLNSASNVPLRLFREVPWPNLIAPDERLAETLNHVHETCVDVFLAVLSAHVAAALWHHFVRRDATLTRMLLGRSAS